MDARDLIENLKGHLTCSVCLGYFSDPVTVKCGHSFCRECLLQCKERATEILTCPECRGVIRCKDLVPNSHLQSLAVIGQKLRPHLLQSTVSLTTCDQHGKQEKFFCEEDQRLLCGSCSSAPEHKAHKVLPWETVANKCRDELKETQTVLGETEEEYEIMLENARKRKLWCKENVSTLKHSVMCEYEKIHQFLWDEEYEHLERIQHESRDGLAKMEENMDELSQQIQNLQEMMLEVQNNLNKAPLEMLRDMQGILERNDELLLQEPELVSPSLSSCSITCLREVLLKFWSDITLDPESANPHLMLSQDLKRVQYGSVHQDLPDNKDRNDCVLAVLGIQTFTSGKHYWEVEVENKTEWELGVCEDSAKMDKLCR
ncbi:probable E3 ubiquitin-protein ligase TRIML1 [Antechinus flavipes]|uniref:probable E3 ubiquitin-protein ligase TRIML1 n=1 Tax=Antechinus flavipes TaxID=38775 RepID=UPI00223606EF|nr:probable E3 ubiquitin-protein ligase TRIML1 [Antechinus flavipes]